MNKHELTNIELFEEDGQYYLKLKYIIESKHKVEEIEIPKVRLPFNKNAVPEVSQSVDYDDFGPFAFPRRECYLHTGCGNSLEVRLGKTSEETDVFYTIKTIKEKAQEMTMAEIEKKLGYKVKIVSEGTK